MTSSQKKGKPATAGPDPRRRAYRAGSRIARDRIEREAPLDAAALAAVEESDIVVVQGCYDHVEQVLAALDLPYTVVAPESVARLDLRPEQLLVVNCPGQIGDQGVERVRRFVESGGSLFSTDWALKHVVQPAFPGTVAHNGATTADEVVRVEIHRRDNPFVAGVLDGEDDPQWWLEGSSYPIRVLDPQRVEVLLTSRELGERYGEAPVAVLFRWGEGEVFHMISHYYLQRTELRTQRHAASAVDYYAEKGVPMSPADYSLADGLAVGDVESAATSARMFANVVAQHKHRTAARRPFADAADPLLAAWPHATVGVFVYGTLLPGNRNWSVVQPFVDRHRTGSVAGTLYDTGKGWPTATFDPDGLGLVQGIVLTLKGDRAAEALAALDTFEGDEYERVVVRAADGRDVMAYRHRGPVDGLTPIRSGRWRAAGRST